MTDPLTQEDLDAIRARLEAATDGPWETGGPYPGVSVIACIDGGCGWPEPEPPEYAPVSILSNAQTGEPHPQHLADANLIAHAPVDIERLLGEVGRVKAERDTADEEANAWLDACGLTDNSGDPSGVTPEAARRYWEGIEAERDKARAEVKRLTTDLETIEAMAENYRPEGDKVRAAIGRRARKALKGDR